MNWVDSGSFRPGAHGTINVAARSHQSRLSTKGHSPLPERFFRILDVLRRRRPGAAAVGDWLRPGATGTATTTATTTGRDGPLPEAALAARPSLPL